MKISIFSMKNKEKGWQKGGNDIKYSKNKIIKVVLLGKKKD
jgi:hypothetical protein